MPEKNEFDDESVCIAPVGWEHPLVKAGFVPGHLLQSAFGYSPSRWSTWVNSHPQLVAKTMNRQPWFNFDEFVKWALSPENADDLPPTESSPKDQRPKREQPRNNRKGVNRGQ